MLQGWLRTKICKFYFRDPAFPLREGDVLVSYFTPQSKVHIT